MMRDAKFSEDRKYRYWLLRQWNIKLPIIMFVGLNPSIADEFKDDQTIRKVIEFSKVWGFGGVYMVNVFAYCATDPDILKSISDPVGRNDFYLEIISTKCTDVLYAFGNFPDAVKRYNEVKKFLPRGKALLLNKNGTPRHPLYVPYNTKPIPFNL